MPYIDAVIDDDAKMSRKIRKKIVLECWLLSLFARTVSTLLNPALSLIVLLPLIYREFVIESTCFICINHIDAQVIKFN